MLKIDRRRDHSAHPPSIKSRIVISNSHTCNKIRMQTDYTAVQEDMTVDSSTYSTEQATRTFEVAQKDYEKNRKTID